MSSTLVSDIESRIDIVELVREYVPLKKSGTNWKGLSPFKPEKSPSFVVSPAKQIAYCFSTNQGGGPIQILMLLEKIEFREALQILAKRAGVELKTDTIQNQASDEKAILTKLYQEVAEFYKKSLWGPEGLEARKYIIERGLSEETLKSWGIGYSSEPREMFESMKKKWFSEKILMESGIFISGYKDRFFGRLLFPIRNYRWDVIAFSGRTLKSWGDEAKYVNSPETPIFHKSNVLFGIDRAKQAIAKIKKVIVVEGQMDTISLHQAGIDNVVGISGTALTEEHIRLIRRLTDQIYLCLDRDEAGKLAILRSIENLRNESVDIYVIDLGWAKDPDEFLRKGGNFGDKIEQAQPAIEFVIETGSSKYDITTNQGKNALLQDVVTMIVQMHGTVAIDQSLRLTAKKLDLSLQSVYFEYNRAVRGRKQQRPQVENTAPQLSWQDYLIAYIAGLARGKELFLEQCIFYPEMALDATFSQLKHCIDGTLDAEALRMYELRFETLTENKKPETILQELSQLINTTDKTIFRKLQKEYAHDIQKLTQLLIKAKEKSLI